MTDLLTTLRDARAALARVTALPTHAAVARKVTRDLDEAIARLEGTESDRDLVSVVCHDLKDPLASIVMGAGFLKKAIPDDQAAPRRVVEAIARSAERLGHVVDDFHDFARLEAGLLTLDPRPSDVVEAARGVVTSLETRAQARKIALTLQASQGPLVAMCDPVRLIHMVTKLVDNALKFTPPDGRVTIGIEGEKDRVRVSVSDTGRGIPAERLPSIYDRAANARATPRDGPGLGLAIVRALVELHRGEISVESRVGGGSVFSFTLPRT